MSSDVHNHSRDHTIQSLGYFRACYMKLDVYCRKNDCPNMHGAREGQKDQRMTLELNLTFEMNKLSPLCSLSKLTKRPFIIYFTQESILKHIWR